MSKIRIIKAIAGFAIVTTGLMAFQNCGQGLEGAPEDIKAEFAVLDSIEDSNVSEDEIEFSTSAVADPDFSRPGNVEGLSIDDGYLAVRFDKGRRKRDRQGLGYQNYHYSKWNFFVNGGTYITTWSNTGGCGDTKQQKCTLRIRIDGFAALRALRGTTIEVQIATLHDGRQSPRTATRSIALPGSGSSSATPPAAAPAGEVPFFGSPSAWVQASGIQVSVFPGGLEKISGSGGCRLRARWYSTELDIDNGSFGMELYRDGNYVGRASLDYGKFNKNINQTYYTTCSDFGVDINELSGSWNLSVLYTFRVNGTRYVSKKSGNLRVTVNP